MSDLLSRYRFNPSKLSLAMGVVEVELVQEKCPMCDWHIDQFLDGVRSDTFERINPTDKLPLSIEVFLHALSEARSHNICASFSIETLEAGREEQALAQTYHELQTRIAAANILSNPPNILFYLPNYEPAWHRWYRLGSEANLLGPYSREIGDSTMETFVAVSEEEHPQHCIVEYVVDISCYGSFAGCLRRD